MFDKEYQQAERLLECMKTTDNEMIAELCRYAFDTDFADRMAANAAAEKAAKEAMAIKIKAGRATNWKGWTKEECEAIENDFLTGHNCALDVILRQDEE